MTERRLDILDPRNEADVAAYERSFYDTFSAVTGNRLIRHLWLWNDDERRLATRIPYEDQVVYLQRDDNGQVDAAIAVNLAMHQQQGAHFGFQAPAKPGLCEFLTFFVLSDHSLRSRYAFWSACFADLRHRGLQVGYATTARRPLAFYRRIGGEVIETAVIEGEERFFLRFSLERDYIRSRTERLRTPAAA